MFLGEPILQERTAWSPLPFGLPSPSCRARRSVAAFGWAAFLVFAGCSRADQSGHCVQTVPSAVVRDETLGGLLIADNNRQCSMQLRLLEETASGLRARLETANHCADLVGQMPEGATLRIFVNGGYTEGLRFTGQFSQGLDELRNAAAQLGTGGTAFADWAVLPTKTSGALTRWAQKEMPAPDGKGYERDMLKYFSGCPTGLEGGKSLCASAGDLYLDHIFIERAALEQRSIGDGSSLATLFRKRLPNHKTLAAAEARLAGSASLGGQAASLFAASSRAAGLARLSRVAPLASLASVCTEISMQGKEEFLADVAEGLEERASGASVPSSFGIRLKSNRSRAEKIWTFCKETGSDKLTALQQRLDAVPLSLDRTLGDLRRDAGEPGLSDEHWSEVSEAAVSLVKASWQALEKQIAASGDFGSLSFATNAPMVTERSTAAQLARTASGALQFQYLPLTALIKGDREKAAFRADERNFGPVFVVQEATDFLIDWKKGASGTIISYHAEGVAIPLAALTSVSDEYSSGGVAVIPLPRSSASPQGGSPSAKTNSAGSGTLAGEPKTSGQPAATSAELDPSVARREGVVEARGGGACL